MPIEQAVIILTAIANLIGIGVALYQLGKAMSKFELIGKQQAKEIAELKEHTGKIAGILSTLAVQDQKYIDLSTRTSRMEQELADLRRGEGFILPLAGRIGGP